MGYELSLEQARKQVKGYTRRPEWRSLSAVKNNRVYGIYHSFLGNMHHYAGVLGLAKALYPEHFRDLHPREELEKFHRRFLPVSADGVWFFRLRD